MMEFGRLLMVQGYVPSNSQVVKPLAEGGSRYWDSMIVILTFYLDIYDIIIMSLAK
jgi:hypothetical protein